LLLSVIGLVIVFGFTGFAARLYHGRRAELARSWFDRGNAQLKAGRAAAALSDFRAALVYAQRELSPEEQQRYKLGFVRALIATGSGDEARSYLLGDQRARHLKVIGIVRENALEIMSVPVGDPLARKRFGPSSFDHVRPVHRDESVADSNFGLQGFQSSVGSSPKAAPL
jgi:hypothetical protein